MQRNYGPVIERVSAAARGGGSREERMRAVVDALWEAFGGTRGGVSWVGFYLAPRGRESAELVLGPHRDKPACSPIGLHGACGQALRTGPLVVADVRALGEAYIACDPRDLSEAVAPVGPGDGEPWGVLDLDSHQVAAFGEADVAGLAAVVRAAGLCDQD